MRDYVEIDAFNFLLLEESYVLDVEAHPASVIFHLDFVLTPGHVEYRTPAPGEAFCIRRGSIRFEGVTRTLWANQGAFPARDASGEIDYGNIDSFHWEKGEYVIEGDWGQMQLNATTLAVKLE